MMGKSRKRERVAIWSHDLHCQEESKDGWFSVHSFFFTQPRASARGRVPPTVSESSKLNLLEYWVAGPDLIMLTTEVSHHNRHPDYNHQRDVSSNTDPVAVLASQIGQTHGGSSLSCTE